ncbi:threonine/serine exporter family protein [Acidaminococcus timonensis]|uniref:threonine/serine exporter family protein n=1 Tax=Acidaminococcus timonensis TaxID=1871002 RepID=UPI0008D8D795|nr:threonine/serine exporter family protein [Acidaminococcus timonensis]
MPLAATIFIKTLFSFFATVAFGKLFNCPRSCLYKAGFVGMVGFEVYIILLSGFGLSSMLSNFAGTVALSICSEIFARWYKQPVPIFSIPGVIPLVPGLPLYRAMNYTMLDSYSMGMHTFVSAALDAMAIAMGILLVSGLAKVYKTSRQLITKKGGK